MTQMRSDSIKLRERSTDRMKQNVLMLTKSLPHGVIGNPKPWWTK